MFSFIKQLLDWLYHRNCYICKKSSILSVCDKCLSEIQLNPVKPVKRIGKVSVYSVCLYQGNLKKIIRAIKYHNKKDLAKPITDILYQYWQQLSYSSDEYEIIPMPLHIKREKERGYNQVLLYAEEFARLTGYSVNNELAQRIKNTKPQYKLSKIERHENLKEAFSIDRSKFNNKKILIFDDICTSGTTLTELIHTLAENEINEVYALVLANPS